MANANEKIIHLSPEEELTDIRRRLEEVQAKRIILVVQQETQLRSNVGWRLLRSRARELGKDVLIISPNPQIRAMAKDAGFKVAESPESPPSGKTRPAGRPVRNAGGKPAPHLRPSLGSNPANSRTSGSGGSGTGTRRQRKPAQQYPISTPSAAQSEAGMENEIPADDEITMTGTTHPSMAPDEQRQQGPDYQFDIEITPASWPGVPLPQHDEEPDYLAADYEMTQQLRKDAQQRPPQSPAIPRNPPPQDMRQPLNLLNASHQLDDDALAYLGDIQPTSLPEQRASLPFSHFEESGPDIADYPTEVGLHGSLEDLGDQGDIVRPRPASAPRRPRNGFGPSDGWTVRERERERDTLRRGGAVSPANNRMGRALPELDSENDEMLPPVPDRPTSVMPTASARPAGTVGEPFTGGIGASASSFGSSRASQTSAPSEPRLVPPSSKPLPGQISKPNPGRSRGGITAGSLAPKKTKSQRPPPPRRRRRSGLLIGVGILVLLALLLFLGSYFLPSADVTLTLPSQSLSLSSLKLVVPAQTLVFDTSVTGTGQATGSIHVGNATAHGTVIFTNTGSVPIDIPSNTIVETDTGVQFLVAADVLVGVLTTPNVGNTNVSSVVAVSPGDAGNVPAASITVIPSESLTKISQNNRNIPVSPSSLTVTNTNATTGGGAAPAKAVSPQDIQKEQSILDGQIQAQLKQWLAQNIRPNDVAGTVINLKKLQALEIPNATPGKGAEASTGTFTEVLKLHLPVLVARAANIQAAVSSQLNVAAEKQKPGYALLSDQPPTWDTHHLMATPSRDGKSIDLIISSATGQIAPNISEETARGWISGKTVSEAQRYLTSKTGEVRNIVGATIQVSPSFFPWVPLLPSRITVHFKAAPALKK